MEPRSKGGKSSTGKTGTGRETLRLRSKGPATVEEVVCGQGVRFTMRHGLGRGAEDGGVGPG